MQLSFREAVREDFSAFFDTCFYADRRDDALRTLVAVEWDVALSNPATLTMLVEDLDRPSAEQIVGCAQAVFVTDAFARWAKSGVSPRVNEQITFPLSDGSDPLMSLDDVRAANSGEGLTILIMRWMWADQLLNTEEARAVRESINRNFQLFCRGYNVKEILMLCFTEKNRERALHSGMRLRHDPTDYSRSHLATASEQHYPFLLGLTRDEARDNEGSFISSLFVYIPPQFYFTEQEQEVLRRAYSGQSDQEIAAALFISASGVKNWWSRIYTRVEEKQPHFFEEGLPKETGGRGREKRRLLLRYLQDHLEELRPVLAPETGRKK